MKVNFNQQPIGNSNFEHLRNKTETEVLDKEIKKLLKKGMTKESNNGIAGERDGTFRMILNLNKLNEYV